MKQHVAVNRQADSKGRITLGESFANRTVLVEKQGNGDVLIRLARVVPEVEAWLYENEEALASVRRGVRQAHAGKFAKRGPDLDAAARLANRLHDA